MKSAILAGALAATLALAQSTSKQSKPFNLKVVSSTNDTLNGRFLTACHSGAAIETLCLGKADSPTLSPDAATFYWNYTQYEDNSTSTEGTLVFNLKLSAGVDGSQMVVSEPLTLDWFPTTNVAATRFAPGSPDARVQVGFNNSALYIDWWVDDSTFVSGVYPTLPSPRPSRQRQNWYVCWVLTGSYYYNALAWVTGGVPQNPTCQAVTVLRVDAST